MQHARAHGYPVPAVVEVAGSDMVMERVDGPTMLAAMDNGPGDASIITAFLCADLLVIFIGRHAHSHFWSASDERRHQGHRIFEPGAAA